MNNLPSPVQTWLAQLLGVQLIITKHIYSHQDEVYQIKAPASTCYLKVSSNLTAERDNLNKVKPLLNVPTVISFKTLGKSDYLLLSELPGKNLAELVGEWSELAVVDKFAEAVRQLHVVDVGMIFPGQARPCDVLLHGDMALPNIIVSEQGQIGYIDFGQLAYGSPDSDLADAIWSLQRNISPDYGDVFLKMYGDFVMTEGVAAALSFRYQA